MIINKYKKNIKILNKNRVKNPGVSVVLPTYNEEQLIEKLVNSLRKELKEHNPEIIIVDDNSKDNTPKIINRLGKSKDIVAIHRIEERGLLSAFIEGFKNAKGKVQIMMDADFSHPPFVIPKLIEKTREYDIATGSRFCKGGGMKASFTRRFSSLLLNKMIRLILGVKLTDFTGNFHAFRKNIFNNLEFKTGSNFGDFDMELIYRAHQKNYTMIEVPFVYEFRKEGTSKMTNLFSFGWKYVKKALILRFS